MKNGHLTVQFLPVCRTDDEVEKEESHESDDILVYETTCSTTVLLESGVPITQDLLRREKQRGALTNP